MRFLLILALPTIAVATTLVPHTLRQRAEESDRVALVQVLEQHVEETKGARIPLKTVTRLLVGQNIRGSGPTEVNVVQLGGRLGLTSMEVPGDATFHVGETAVVFLRCRLAVDRCHLVALGQGKLDVEGDFVFVQDLVHGTWARRPLSSLIAELVPVPSTPVGNTVVPR